MASPIISAEAATVANFLEEKERIRGTNEAEAVITWANSMGIEEREDSDADAEAGYENEEDL
jgi:hypothetical protein